MALVSLFRGQEIELLDSVMPGGDNWAECFKNKNHDCLPFCPYFNKPCDAHGPRNLCSMGAKSALWRKAPENMATLAVLLHVLANFKHYDRGDFKGAADSEKMIGRMTKRIESRLREHAKPSGKTEGDALTRVRYGQGALRTLLITERQSCDVTGVQDPKLLRASHIVPWSEDEKNRMNPSNVLLLVAPLDFLFNQYLISFDVKGRVHIAPDLEKDKASMKLFGLSKGMKIRKVPREMRRFLEKHRQRFRDLHGI